MSDKILDNLLKWSTKTREGHALPLILDYFEYSKWGLSEEDVMTVIKDKYNIKED